MKIIIPQFLEENQLLKKIDELSYAKYIQCQYQEKNELEILSNILIFVTKGKKILHLPFGDKTINAGDILFLKSGNYVISEVVDESYEAFLFFYSDELLVNFIQKHNIELLADTKNTNLFSITQNRYLEAAISSMVPYFESENPINKELIKLKFEELFLNILASNNEADFRVFLSSLYNEDVLFKTKIQNNYMEFRSVKEMASYLKMSEVNLRAKFQKVFSATPKKWLLLKKLQYAKVLLRNSELNVTQVMQKVGFSDSSWFSQSFKKEFGITPKEYKNNKN